MTRISSWIIQDHAIPLTALLTYNGRGCCGSDIHPFEFYLQPNDLAHRRTTVRRLQTNGVVKRLHRTVLDEYFRLAFRQRLYESVEAPQRDLDAWLIYDNLERPHQGYQHIGKWSIDTLNTYGKQVRSADPM